MWKRYEFLVEPLICLSLFFLSLELPITEAAHGLFSRFLGPAYLLIHPFTALVILLWISGALKPREIFAAKQNWLIPILAFGVLLSSIIGQSEPLPVAEYIFFGCLSVLVGIMVSRICRESDLYARCFVGGMIAWALIFLGSYVLYASDLQVNGDFDWSQAMLAIRSPGADIANDSLFFHLVGNINKCANYAVLFAVAAWLLRDRIGPLLLWSATILLAAVSALCFSRGAFVVQVLIFAGIIVISLWDRKPLERRKVALAAVMLLPVVFSFSTTIFRSYWTDTETVDRRLMLASDVTHRPRIYGAEQDCSVLGGTCAAEEDATPCVVDDNPPAPNPFFGYGIGNYGLTHFCSIYNGTHVFFVDAWADGGIIGFIAMLGYFLWNLWSGAVKLLRRRFSDADLFGTIGLCAIIVLSLREYALAYLFVTSMGGILVGFFAGLVQFGALSDD